MRFQDGPYIQAACFCDMVIEDKSGVLSLIRIIDNLVHTIQSPNPPEEMEPFTHVLKFVLMLKAGEARGRYTIRVVPELPGTELQSELPITAYLNGEDTGQNIIAEFAFQFRQEGLHWFHIYLGEDHLTSLPLRIRYNRVVVPMGH